MTLLTDLKLLKVSVTGGNGSGPLSAPEVQIGDLLLKIEQPGYEDGFENVISADGFIKQTTSWDWSQVPLTFYFLRGTMP